MGDECEQFCMESTQYYEKYGLLNNFGTDYDSSIACQWEFFGDRAFNSTSCYATTLEDCFDSGDYVYDDDWNQYWYFSYNVGDYVNSEFYNADDFSYQQDTNDNGYFVWVNSNHKIRRMMDSFWADPLIAFKPFPGLS